MLLASWRRMRLRRSSPSPLRLLLVGLLVAGQAFAGTLRVEVLDVGQGDAILIRSPAGKVVLVDAGDAPEEAHNQLKQRGITQLDLVVATHPHADHIGGMQTVVERIPVKLYTDNGLPHSTQTYIDLMRVVEDKGIPYREAVAGTTYRLDDGATLEVLFPAGQRLRGTRSDLNSNSVVLRLRHQGNCFLLTGDSEEPTERALVEAQVGQCGVLKVAHHGSDHSSTAAFLDEVKPKLALVSVGTDNRYNHPGQGAMQRLEAAGVDIHRTDLEGTLLLTSSEQGVHLTAIPRTAQLAIRPIQAAPPLHAHVTPPGAFDLPAKASSQCEFPASAKSRVFHEPTCGNAKKIKPTNLRCYQTAAAATADGRQHARCCKSHEQGVP
jgi:competence protein ComEC